MLDRLPDEVAAIILEAVPPKQLLDLQLCCRWLDKLVRTSSLAMYRIECWAAGVHDTTGPGLPYADRRALLRSRERAWRQLECKQEIHITIPFEACGTFDLADGFLVLGRERAEAPFAVSALDLDAVCGRPDPMGQSWRDYTFSDQVVDYALAIGSLDLIAVMTAVPAEIEGEDDVERPIMHSFDLHFVAASTGSPHPLAGVPTVHLCSELGIVHKPTALMEIVGDWMLVHIYNRYAPRVNSITDALYCVNWKSGASSLLMNVNTHIYQGIVMLTQDLVLFPNMSTFAIDVYSFTEDAHGAANFVQLHSFALPEYYSHLTITETYCQAKPDLHPRKGVSAASRPRSCSFVDHGEDAIIVFTFEFDSDGIAATLIVHRQTMLHAFLASARAGDGAAPSVPYERWAAGRCFWLSHHIDWFVQPAGQRFAWPIEAWENGASTRLCSVWDFNPYSVSRALQSPEDEEAPSGSTVSVRYGRELRKNIAIFDGPVECGLPYIQTTFNASEPVGGFLLDDHRLLSVEPSELWHWGSNMSGFTMKVFA